MYIEMTKESFTGNREIDAHHRHLVESFNAFLGAFRLRKQKEELGPLLDNLVDYATYHFSAEELWMMDMRYPDVAAHIEEHAAFVRRLSDIQRNFAAGRPAVSLEVLAFLSSWLKTHMRKSDAQVTSYCRKSGQCAKAA
ncbi:bacteriohemerythrin [Geomonas subterranea]|uniref:bacteriohemerythrin n=1 Tax=Geomonas subterranea TaxID=2847989 RepID=UPI001CD799C0|nr:bacteriohemerythrin [Geomonas fuzhouensis]